MSSLLVENKESNFIRYIPVPLSYVERDFFLLLVSIGEFPHQTQTDLPIKKYSHRHSRVDGCLN